MSDNHRISFAGPFVSDEQICSIQEIVAGAVRASGMPREILETLLLQNASGIGKNIVDNLWGMLGGREMFPNLAYFEVDVPRGTAPRDAYRRSGVHAYSVDDEILRTAPGYVNGAILREKMPIVLFLAPNMRDAEETKRTAFAEIENEYAAHGLDPVDPCALFELYRKIGHNVCARYPHVTFWRDPDGNLCHLRYREGLVDGYDEDPITYTGFVTIQRLVDVPGQWWYAGTPKKKN